MTKATKAHPDRHGRQGIFDFPVNHTGNKGLICVRPFVRLRGICQMLAEDRAPTPESIDVQHPVLQIVVAVVAEFLDIGLALSETPASII